jgi:hypothetical protein
MKKWYSYIILALVCIGFASCQDSDMMPQLQTDGRVSVHLQIALPGGDSAQRGATARDFTDDGTDDTTSDQKALSDDDVFVLVFQNGVLIDQVKGLRFDAVTGGTNPSSRTLTGTFVQPETDESLELVVLTNLVQNQLVDIANSSTLSGIQAFFDRKKGSSPSEIYESLIYQYGSSKWNIQSRRIPMWGTTGTFSLDRANELKKSCNLHRAVAKLGFLINATNAGSEGQGIDGFMITGISIKGMMDKGYCVSQAAMSNDYYTTPYVPAAAGTQTITYSDLYVTTSYKDRIYLPEQVIQNHPLTIAVSYTYKGKAKTKEITFDENVIRNHSYLYNITAVTPDDFDVTISYAVEEWKSETINVPTFK